MKKLIFILLVFVWGNVLQAQSLDIKTKANYHSPGQLSEKFEYYYDFWQEREVMHGRFESWNSQGQLIESMVYAEGKKDGLEIRYHPRGYISHKIRWRKGEIHGSYQEFYPNKQLKIILLYESGIKEGMFQEFYQTGMLKSRGAYKNGFLHGPWLLYDQRGVMKKSKSYIMGKKEKEKKIKRS
ncbi:MAG: hypothetical protein MRZ79_08015 [Bacteroidia bacterium]|nr:hypothetical protein [Bacteroidia bacterium]